MKQGQNLLQVMNEVSNRLDRAPLMASRPRQPLSELQAFIEIDPLLADLHKQYLDAKTARMQSNQQYGDDDGMTSMAAILEDSAWCAMQTRYMEVRANRRLMANAQALMEESRREAEEREREQQKLEALKAFEQMQMFTRLRAEQEKKSVSFWILALFLLRFQPDWFRDHHATYRFNRLAA